VYKWIGVGGTERIPHSCVFNWCWEFGSRIPLAIYWSFGVKVYGGIEVWKV